MACDYAAIRAANERRYGTDMGRIGQVLLAGRYDGRTHFIYELLQNAEDTLAKRFDLFAIGSYGNPIPWCEAEAMTASLDDRLVGLSRRQFLYSSERGSAYWLYAVEHAGTDSVRIVCIQDPAGRARAFTFDRGWLAVVEVDPGSEERED